MKRLLRKDDERINKDDERKSGIFFVIFVIMNNDHQSSSLLNVNLIYRVILIRKISSFAFVCEKF